MIRIGIRNFKNTMPVCSKTALQALQQDTPAGQANRTAQKQYGSNRSMLDLWSLCGIHRGSSGITIYTKVSPSTDMGSYESLGLQIAESALNHHLRGTEAMHQITYGGQAITWACVARKMIKKLF